MLIVLLIIAAVPVADGEIAADAATRFTAGLKTSVETDCDDFGADGEEADDGFK